MAVYKRLANGFLGVTIETIGVDGKQERPTWRFQLYWPEFSIRDEKGLNFFIGLDNSFRIVWGSYSKGWKGTYRGFGFKLLGFGFGFDRQTYIRN